MKFSIFALLLGLFTLVSCDIEQTEKGALPDIDVDVDAEAGNLPEYDVDWMDVDVTTRTKTIEVPKVVVVMEEEEIEVPVVDFEAPNASGMKEEVTLTVDAEVTGEAADLDIKEVYATGNRLYVIAELENNGTDLGDQTMRVSDQIILNASDDLDVKYYIIGDRPNRTYNTRYVYVKDRADLDTKLRNGKAIYTKS